MGKGRCTQRGEEVEDSTVSCNTSQDTKGGRCVCGVSVCVCGACDVWCVRVWGVFPLKPLPSEPQSIQHAPPMPSPTRRSAVCLSTGVDHCDWLKGSRSATG